MTEGFSEDTILGTYAALEARSVIETERARRPQTEAQRYRALERRRAGEAYDRALEARTPGFVAARLLESAERQMAAQETLTHLVGLLMESLDASRNRGAGHRAGTNAVERQGLGERSPEPSVARPATTPLPPLARVYELRRALGIFDNTDLRGMDNDAMLALLAHLEGEVAQRTSEK